MTEAFPDAQQLTARTIREHWISHLDPNLRKDPWTPEEDLALLTHLDALGLRWAKIAKEIPGRSEHVVKNRYKSLTKSAKRRFRGRRNIMTLYTRYLEE
jgi:hypothetical protein